MHTNVGRGTMETLRKLTKRMDTISSRLRRYTIQYTYLMLYDALCAIYNVRKVIVRNLQ